MTISLEQTTVEVGGESYLVQAFPATYGLDVMQKMIKVASGESELSVQFMSDVIIRSVDYKGRRMDEKTFNIHFSRKYNEINELFEKIMEFNFGEASPNDGSDDSENEGISE